MRKQKLKKILWKAARVFFIMIGFIGLCQLLLLIFFPRGEISYVPFIARLVINIMIGVLGIIELKKRYL